MVARRGEEASEKAEEAAQSPAAEAAGPIPEAAAVGAQTSRRALKVCDDADCLEATVSVRSAR